MNYKISIVDDDPSDIEYVSDLVRRWAGNKGHTADLTAFSSAEAFLFAYEDDRRHDIILLDIEMGEMDGVELARRLRRENETMQIVFVTGYSDYISEGYEVAALHYLMKPVDEEKFFTVLDRAVDRLHKAERVLTVETADGLTRVPLRQIRYVDVLHNYVTVHAAGDYTVKMPLGEAEKLLDERFYRVGRSAIVNLTCVSRVTKTDVYLNDGSVVPLPRGAYEGLNRAIINME